MDGDVGGPPAWATGAAQASGIELALWWSAAIALAGAVLALALKERALESNAISAAT
ncbi:hypothetical protein AK972_5080 [Pseudomonas yamanorum]|nr:hypothetical protein AK972_5080 [Pseudomonas yamanorum]